ncbi:MAG TPA: heme o synthase [Bacteriovoracaceae bacterium]|nr:heme o synthase [Bacteriovoracaceae bacterium]
MTPSLNPLLVIYNDKFSVVNDFLSLTKPRLSALVIFTCALGMYLAPGEISLLHSIIAIAATSCLVGGACAINCFMEKDIDALMERTKSRPLPSGRIASKTALMFGLSLIVGSLVTIYFIINPLTAVLGFIAAAVYIFLYTPMKTRTSWALFAGAIPGAIPPLMGWTSVTNSIGSLGLVLFGILFIWQLPHFLSIAIYHVHDYNRAEIKTFPGSMGIGKTISRIAFYTYLLFFISLVPFYIGAASETYKHIIIFLGGSYFLYSLLGYAFEEGSPSLLQWARRYFYASLMYLPCVFILMIFFRENS